MTTWEPASTGVPRSSASTRSPPPGAQAPSHGASSTLPLARGDAGVAEAGPALARRGPIRGLGLRDELGRHPEQDHVVHHVGVAGLHVEAGDERVLGELGVEQEAAVVVGAGAVGGRGRVRRRHRQPGEPLDLAQRRCPRARSRRLRGSSCACASTDGSADGAVVVDGAFASVSGVPPQPASTRLSPTAQQPGRAAAGHPGGQVIVRPPSTCRCAWKTVWCAAAPVLNTSR